MSRRRAADVDQARHDRLVGLMTTAEVRELEQLHAADPDLPMYRWPARRFAAAVELFRRAYERLPEGERWIEDEAA